MQLLRQLFKRISRYEDTPSFKRNIMMKTAIFNDLRKSGE